MELMSNLPCEHRHSGYQKHQKEQAKMIVTGPLIPPGKTYSQAEGKTKNQ